MVFHDYKSLAWAPYIIAFKEELQKHTGMAWKLESKKPSSIKALLHASKMMFEWLSYTFGVSNFFLYSQQIVMPALLGWVRNK